MKRFSLYDARWRAGDYRPHFAAYYYREWTDFRMGFHAHPEIEIMYAISGSCCVETEERSFVLRGGDFILLDSGVPHRLVVEGDEACRMLNVEFSFIPCERELQSWGRLVDASPSLQSLVDRPAAWLSLSDTTHIQHTLKRLVLELDESGPERTGLANLLVGQLLVEIARLEDARHRGGGAGQSDRYVRQAVEYIHQHYDRDLKARDIASFVNLHPVYLQRIFRQHMRVSMSEYIMNIRVDKAKMLLGRTDIPIAEIADYVGLNSRQYFSEVFKRCTGQTPAAYRKSIELVSW